MAWAAGGAVWQQLCIESAGRAGVAGLPRYRTRLWLLGGGRFADGCSVPVAGPQWCTEQRGQQRDLE
ncbi:hypothetical protein D3C84_854340 [compost metagenome]